ncbi:MAG: radical SAM protein [Candidatus Omnitrophica bacterium]|nr:radical SAM protein [Candidatus Omnitrophota bacterium]
MLLRRSPDTEQKLTVLSKDSQYDLACACGTREEEHRRRSKEQKWIYPVALPQGGRTFLFKTLLSNECVNDCRYCPLRNDQDPQRCRLTPEEMVRAFLRYLREGRVSGLFLSSGVMRTPDETMGRMNAVARKLRRGGFRGYIHLKIIPGASDAAIRAAVSLASAVSVNIEAAGAQHFQELTRRKQYQRDILRSLRMISRLTSRGSRFDRVKHTTQFIVGAGRDSDREIVGSSWALYRTLGLHRVYFSAYQRGLGDRSLPGERSGYTNEQLLTREHRLYQVDWLLRRYGFCADEIPFDLQGNLSLRCDPKELWARAHPEFFPVAVNRADRSRLLRVPGLGEVTVKRILGLRSSGRRIRRLEDLGRAGARLRKADQYLCF